jgi:predicted transcriptional regulator
MSDPLENGAVLPTGLLAPNHGAMMEGFNKSYKNFPLRVGIVIASYPPDDDRNRSKLTIEYDVSVIEQNADISATNIVYRNCMSAEGLGSIADYFEMALRFKKQKMTKGDAINTKGQDGAIVLMLCLDGMSDKGIIIGALTHPDRETNLTDQGPLLVGEYNGVKIMVNTDGSTSLTFRGATDNMGNVIDSTQGTTTWQIKTDGSFEFMHDAIDILADRKGALTVTTKTDIILNATGNVTATCKDATVTASGDATVTASGKATVEGQTVNLGKGASDAVIKGDTFKKYFDTLQVATALGPSGPPIMPMPPTSLSKKVKTE